MTHILGTDHRVIRAASAAEEFPKAEVLAVDMTELPPRFIHFLFKPFNLKASNNVGTREFPPNVCFQQLDVLKDFPWKDPFDVIHMRLLLFHVIIFCQHSVQAYTHGP